MGVAPPLRCVSLLAANGTAFYGAVVDYLAAAAGLPARPVTEASAPLADLHAAGTVDLAFTCGLPYVRLADARPGALALLGAPVLPGARYGGRPIYFSDFIVRAEAPWQSLAELRGAAFAFNQPESLSGYVLPRHHLHTLGEGESFFGRWLPSGSHAASLDWVEQGAADCAAIDSFVLAFEFRQRPERAQRLRVVGSAGPLTMPPVVADASLPAATLERLGSALRAMHTTAAGQAVLAAAGVERFAAVTDGDYDDIRMVLAREPYAG